MLRVAIPSEGAPFASALQQALGVELRPGHAVTLLSNGAVFDALDEEIRKARSSVHILLYIWEKGAASEPHRRTLRSSRHVSLSEA